MVFAGGNDRQSGGNSNDNNIQNSRVGITVGAINAQADVGALITSNEPFSNPGASLLISAPGSNVTSTSRLIKTDNGSTFGNDFSATQGTSFATPIVSGIATLMLQANPNLGCRDVQRILAVNARQVDDPNTQWAYNGSQT